MNDFKNINEIKPDILQTCQCSKLPSFAHESNQHLLIIQAYVNGCTERLKESTLDHNQLTDVLNKISHHADAISNRIHCMLTI